MALGTTNITTTLVGTTIGSASRDVGSLCGSLLINPNSLHKPVSYPTLGAITDVQRKEVNYGFDIQTYSNITNAINAYNNGKRWEYIKPTGGISSPFRIGDFRGYDHFAASPITFNLLDDTIVENGSVPVDIGTTLSVLNWGAFLAFAPTYNQLQFGFFCPEIGIWYPLTSYGGTNILDLEDTVSVSLPDSTFTEGNTYSIYPLFTNYSYPERVWTPFGSLTNGDWIIIGTEKKDFAILQPETPLTKVSLYGVSGYGTYDEQNDLMSLFTVGIGIINNNPNPISGTCVVTVSTPFEGTKTLGSTSIIVAGNSQDESNVISGSISWQPLDGSSISVTITYSFTYGSDLYTKVSSFNFEPEYIV